MSDREHSDHGHHAAEHHGTHVPEQHGHPHERHHASAPSGEPYPFVFSRDVFDSRRYMAPGEGYGPAQSRLPRAGVIATWVILLGFAALIIASIVTSIAR